MSQQILYETEQFFMYKGKKLHIRFTNEYFDAVPRPIDAEKKLLKEDIWINGLEEAIKINDKGIVLDGHTRIEICEELGWKKRDEKSIIAKYDVKEFKTKEEEREYVIKTNLMRRQLNTFQKVKLVSNLYNNNPHSQREETRYDVLLELKKAGEPVQATELAKRAGQHRGNMSKVLRGLKEDYCVNYKEVLQDLHKTRQPAHFYYILPKGEEVLYKGRPDRTTLKTLGRSVGVGRDMVSRAIFLMNHAPPYMLAKLELGEIGIMKAYLEVTKPDSHPRTITSYHYLKGHSKVVCPKCDQVSLKREWKLFNDGE